MSPSRKPAALHPFAALSFVADRDGKTLPKPRKGQTPRCFWHVKSTGDYSRDCDIGEALALEYLAFEEADVGGPGNLQMIVGDMPRQLTGVEIGFLIMVSYAAGAGAGHARQVSSYWDRCRAQTKPKRSAAA